MMVLKEQIISFLVSFTYGFFLHFLMSKIYGYLFYKKRLLKVIFDAIFCISSALMYFFILLLLNNGIIHSYFFLFLIFGFLLSNRFFSNK